MTNPHDTDGSTTDEVDIAIIGAGIGGLAAAVALRHAGLDVQVFERAAVLKEIGGAVVIREPIVRMIERWGLGAAFHADAVPVEVLEERGTDGTVLGTIPADLTGEGQAYSVHRADLHGLLLSGVPDEVVHLGVGTTEVVNDGDRAVARFDDGTQVAAKLVVGADGIRSVTRRAVVQDELVFGRVVILRGLAPASALPAGVSNDRLTLWGQGELTMLALPLRAGTVVALDTGIAADEPPADLWDNEVPTETLLEAFAGFDPGLLDLIKAGTRPVSAHPVYEREPIQNWSVGRITLLGDAAHPMAPRQGQGANQAIRDADALADALSATGLGDVVGALERYQAVRVGPAAEMQIASRALPAFVSSTS